MTRYSDRCSDRAPESVGLATCSQRGERREERVESREQRVESRGTLRFGLTRHSLRSWLVLDTCTPALLRVTNRLKSIGQLQTAGAHLVAVAS